MEFPLADWQFWFVTACAAGAVWLLVKPFVGRGARPTGPCASCPRYAAPADRESGDRSKLLTIRS